MAYKYELIMLVPEHTELNGISSIVEKYAEGGANFTSPDLGCRMAYPMEKGGMKHATCDKLHWRFNMAWHNASNLERELNKLNAHFRYLLIEKEK